MGNLNLSCWQFGSDSLTVVFWKSPSRSDTDRQQVSAIISVISQRAVIENQQLGILLKKSFYRGKARNLSINKRK
jgi:hypothetical protein